MSKFKVGDKVITIKDTPLKPEGWIGYVFDDKSAFGYHVDDVTTGNRYSFEEHELGLLKRDDITPNDFKGIKDVSALDKQVSGNHYKDCGIQPIEYIHANGLNYFEGNAVKYITRHRKKNGKADIEKAIHYLELLLEMEYKEQ